ncbi:MAG: CAAX prenyl protease-related protein, partial [Planctomycetota bacterium]
PYIVPLGLYLVGTSLLSSFPQNYALGYAAVAIVVAASLVWSLRGRELVRTHRQVGGAVAVGLVGILLWLGLSSLGLERQVAQWLPAFLRPSDRPGFNPWQELPTDSWSVAFVVVRLVGLVVLVPVAEELFWRGFLWRWLQDPDWERQPIGQWHRGAFFGVTALFTLAHPEWFAAAVYGALIGLLLVWKRDLWLCIVAHATSNFVLGIYILGTHSWQLW